MDGLLIIDKPAGPTSHDVVARLRRVLGERRIGHTGTLDPLATGVLPLVIGRATRLARFLSASDKSYEATVRLGFSTDTADAAGTPVGPPFSGVLPTRETIDRALDAFRGTFLQQPPAFSAKKIDGRRSYKLARHDSAAAVLPEKSQVTAIRIDVMSVDEDRVVMKVDCSAGFYIRSLADDLGRALGTGAHLERLRRTRSGDFTIADASDLATVEQDPDCARASVVPLAAILPRVPAAVLTADGVRHAVQGRDLGPADLSRDSGFGSRDSGPEPVPRLVRLLHPNGGLVGIAEPAHTSGLLHPFVILM
jgi:tRNA pseudouridine55 synthase